MSKLPDFEKFERTRLLSEALEKVQDVVRWYPLPEDVASSLAVVIDELRYSRNNLGLTE